ncbi:hypothetical protein [Desulfovibrio sp. DV]|uniref:hypothetical protein n=1 Tax=Desulfovibrio sp. DV TaxID=1844708 RepID=UPI00094BAFD9|nr:hypothetical protein [Desulfovibrio sp. DV]
MSLSFFKSQKADADNEAIIRLTQELSLQKELLQNEIHKNRVLTESNKNLEDTVAELKIALVPSDAIFFLSQKANAETVSIEQLQQELSVQQELLQQEVNAKRVLAEDNKNLQEANDVLGRIVERTNDDYSDLKQKFEALLDITRRILQELLKNDTHIGTNCFDETLYLKNNLDINSFVETNVLSSFEHWLLYGSLEKRLPCFIKPAVPMVKLENLNHMLYLRELQIVFLAAACFRKVFTKDFIIFDNDKYLEVNGDVNEHYSDHLEQRGFMHWVLHGFKEGRKPYFKTQERGNG